jgi:hypothetical protein
MSGAGSVNVPAVFKSSIFNLSDWLLDIQMTASAYTDRTSLLSALANQFNNVLGGFDCGLLVSAGSLVFPEWISFSRLDIANTDPAKDNTVKIWFSDSSFKEQYDQFELFVIPSVNDLNSFFGTKANLELALSSFNTSDFIDKLDFIRGNNPESYIHKDSYIWTKGTEQLNVNWSIVVYGRVGDNAEAVKQAIQDYIVQKSTKTKAEWTSIFPDIYKNTEFTILPRWHNYARAQRILVSGIYSPICNLNKELGYAKSILSGYPAEFINTNVFVLPTQYKSLVLLVVGGVTNRDNLFKITDVYPDYINVPTTDPSFESMDTATKSWILQLTELIIAAETLGVNDPVPSGSRKVARGNVLYISKKINGIEYLISTKSSTPQYS